jgi:LacI family transcriptional regulator
MAAKISSRDVAKLAGVSQATVSLILNDSNRVSFSEQTRDKVRAAARELGYELPEKKGGLRKTGLVLVLVPTLSNPYYSELGRMLESLGESDGIKIIVCNTSRKSETEGYYLDFFMNAGINGIIYTFLPSLPQRVGLLANEIPIAIIGEKQDELSICSIELSNFRSAALLGDHLYELGHRRFAFISTNLNRMTLARRQRLEGLRLAAVHHGLGEDAVQLISPPEALDESNADSGLQPYEYTMGKTLTADALANGSTATALIGVNDMTAIGIMNALNDAGYKIPEDYSVCGFDNIFLSAITSPGITTIDHHLSMRCRAALDIIIAGNKTNTSDGSKVFTQANKIEYTPRLIVRGSTGIAAER